MYKIFDCERIVGSVSLRAFPIHYCSSVTVLSENKPNFTLTLVMMMMMMYRVDEAGY
jgi:hypothetical protein